MSMSDPTGTDWSDQEIDLIIADYFDMLNREMSGDSYVKAHRNAELQRLTGRSRGSIEFKHQNISAVLMRLGMPWILGYKPMANYQRALIDGIDRFLSHTGQPIAPSFSEVDPELSEEADLYFEDPPRLVRRNLSEPQVLERLIRKFDPAERDSRNRMLGKLGEKRVLLAEQTQLKQAGRPDLASNVRWIAQEEGDGAGFDILSFDHSGTERLLEVKTTLGHQSTPFYLTENERSLSDERPEAFRIVRLYDFARTPRAFQLAPPLSESLLLQATIYRASVGP